MSLRRLLIVWFHLNGFLGRWTQGTMSKSGCWDKNLWPWPVWITKDVVIMQQTYLTHLQLCCLKQLIKHLDSTSATSLLSDYLSKIKECQCSYTDVHKNGRETESVINAIGILANTRVDKTWCVNRAGKCQCNKKKWPINAEKNMNHKVAMKRIDNATKLAHADRKCTVAQKGIHQPSCNY